MKNPSLVEAIFLRSKIQPASTWLWRSIPLPIETIILNQVVFNTNEQAILCFYMNPDRWWVLTTENLMLNFNSIKKVHLNEIQDVELNKLFDDSVNKLEINTIQFSVNNKSFDLEVEKRTWHVVFKMFKFILSK